MNAYPHLSDFNKSLRRYFMKKGQGLLEVVVAIGVLSTGVFSAVTLMTSGLNSAIENEARFKASNLVREGVEAVRGIRDSNWLQSNVWDTGLYGAGLDYTGTAVFDGTTGIWSIDFDADEISDAEALFRADLNGFLLQAASSGTETQFRRLITLNPICFESAGGTYSVIQNGVCPEKKVGIEVRSEVRWSVGSRTHNLSFVENIYDWR